MNEARATGTPLIPTVPWGTHFCQFYNSQADLLDQVVPYLKAGLERNEAVVWVTSPPLTPPAAREVLRAAVGDIDLYESRRQLFIAPHTEWYLQGGVFDRQRVLDGWLAFLQTALDCGFDGLRVTGNTAWLEKAGWSDFTEYEHAISGAIAGRPVLVLCTYDLERCGANEILDVVKNHDFALIKRGTAWEVIESHDSGHLRDALHRSQDRYKALFEHTLTALALHEIVTDDRGVPIDYIFLDVNAAFEQATGLKARDVIGRRVTAALPGIERTRFIEIYGQVALTGESIRFESFAEPLDRYYDINAFSPAPRQFATAFQDITAQKRAAEERERLYREARDANQLKDEFLATLSHELRSPLNAILGWSHVLLTDKPDPPTRVRATEAIARNAEAQRKLIGDILDVSRIITGKLRLNLSEVDLLNVLDDALVTVRPAADGKRIRIDCVAPKATPRVFGDRDRLQQVLWNLLANAVKFTPSGGTITVEIGAVESRIEIRIADTGDGIPREFLPRVFDRFAQADGAPTRKHGGLGLGLAIVRHLVELHGGTVRADSDGEGRGATFTVQLPVRAVLSDFEPARRREGAAAITAAAEDLTGIPVLVVDDDRDARQLIDYALSEAGATVILAESAEEALALLGQTGIGVIVSDIGMPSMDGYQLIRAVRTLDGPVALIPAIALTAFGRDEDAARALACGYQQHITKPVPPAMLVAAVAQAWRLGSGESRVERL